MSEGAEQTLKSRTGEALIISLPVNLTTGFKWEIDYCDQQIEFQKLPYRQVSTGLGGGGIQRFNVVVKQSGEFVIRFKLMRPWETEVREVRTFKLVTH